MAWFKFTLQQQNTSFFSQIESIPGVGVRGLEVTCHDNAAWLVERIARTTGVRYTVVETKGDREELEALDKLVEGGLRDWVPGYLTEYQREGVMAMAHRDGHYWWAAGCLAGDTVVDARWACAEHRLKLRELVGRFNGEVGGWRGPIEVLSYNEATGGMVWNKLEAAVVSGVKQLFRLRTMRGYIDATADHRFLTPNGWKRLGELVAGLDMVFFRNGFSDGAHLVGVQKIQPLGRAPTFDLCMAAPHHNFVANGIVVHNSGKTLGAICWSLASPGRTVLVTRAGVRRQHAREIERVTTHRALVLEESADADKLVESGALFCLVGYEMLPDVVDRLLLWKPVNLILDECFPQGTKIETAGGLRAIETLLPGDLVASVDAQGQKCYRPVCRVIVKKRTVPLVRVVHSSGELVCTENHKIWTLEDGYVPAGRLESRHHLRMVREGTGDSENRDGVLAPVLRTCLLRAVESDTARSEGVGRFGGQDRGRADGRSSDDVAAAGVQRGRSGADAGTEPHVRRGNAGTDDRKEAWQTILHSAWWEREGINTPAEYGFGVVSYADGRVFGWDSTRSPDGNRHTTVLYRFGPAREEASIGDRWKDAPYPSGEGTGCEEGCDPVFSGVVRVEALQQGDTGGAGIGAVEGEFVFDLEVEETHCYFAEGVLVSNCHRAKAHRRWSATAQADGKVKFDMLSNIATAAYRLSRAARRRLATTATPIKDRTRDLWAQLDLVHPDAWGRFYSKDRASFTGRYCAARDGAYGGVDTSGASNLEELWNRVSLVTHHVPHSVTHRHLPPRRRVVTYVTPAEQCRAEGFTQKFFKQAAKGGGKTGLLEARLMEAAARKRKALLEMVEEAVSCKQKVTIFTGRREDCDRLGEEVKKAHPDVDVWCAHGGTPAKDRDAIQQAYMKHAGPCVLVGTGDAWGEGVSLHDSDLALIAMLPYTPGAVVQWEGRFSRQGQKRPVLIQYLVAEGSVDEHVVELLVGKLKPVEEVAHDDSIEGFSDSLRGLDDEEAIVSSILAKLGVTGDAKGDK